MFVFVDFVLLLFDEFETDICFNNKKNIQNALDAVTVWPEDSLIK